MIFALLICLLLFLGAWVGKPPSAVIAQGTNLPAEVNNSFTPYTIVAGERSVLSVKIFNLNPFPLNDAFWIDYLLAGIYLDNPVDATTDCGGAIDATPGWMPGKERSRSSASGT